MSEREVERGVDAEGETRGVSEWRRRGGGCGRGEQKSE